MSSATQYVEFSSGGGKNMSAGGATRWEQGTCNARFKDEALKIGQKDSMSNGQKVEFCTRILFPLYILLDELSKLRSRRWFRPQYMTPGGTFSFFMKSNKKNAKILLLNAELRILCPTCNLQFTKYHLSGKI